MRSACNQRGWASNRTNETWKARQSHLEMRQLCKQLLYSDLYEHIQAHWYTYTWKAWIANITAYLSSIVWFSCIQFHRPFSCEPSWCATPQEILWEVTQFQPNTSSEFLLLIRTLFFNHQTSQFKTASDRVRKISIPQVCKELIFRVRLTVDWAIFQLSCQCPLDIAAGPSIYRLISNVKIMYLFRSLLASSIETV